MVGLHSEAPGRSPPALVACTGRELSRGDRPREFTSLSPHSGRRLHSSEAGLVHRQDLLQPQVW